LDAANEASMIAALDGCENGFDSVQGLVSRHRPSLPVVLLGRQEQ
jgi:hypothetical protein